MLKILQAKKKNTASMLIIHKNMLLIMYGIIISYRSLENNF